MKQHKFTVSVLRVFLVAVGTLAVFVGVTAAMSVAVRSHSAAAQDEGVGSAAMQVTAQHSPIPSGAIADRRGPPITIPILPEKAGELIHNRAMDAANVANRAPFQVLRRSDKAPVLTVEDALKVMQDMGYPYAFGSEYNGKPVTITAYYGLFTHGVPENTTGLHDGDGKSPRTGPCEGWAGLCNIPVQTCTAGTCTPTGKVIGRIENRPYWILDFANVESGHTQCPTCPEIPNDNHTVIAIDALDKFVLTGWSYTAP